MKLICITLLWDATKALTLLTDLWFYTERPELSLDARDHMTTYLTITKILNEQMQKSSWELSHDTRHSNSTKNTVNEQDEILNLATRCRYLSPRHGSKKKSTTSNSQNRNKNNKPPWSEAPSS